MTSEPPATAPEARPSASMRGLVADRVDPALPPVIRAGVVEVLSAMLGGTTVADRIDGFVAVVDGSRRRNPTVDPFARGPDRLALFMQVIEGDLDLRAAFRRSLDCILSEMTGENLFGETGVPHRRGFIGEFFGARARVRAAFAAGRPRPVAVAAALFQREREAQGFLELPPGSSRAWRRCSSLPIVRQHARRRGLACRRLPPAGGACDGRGPRRGAARAQPERRRWPIRRSSGSRDVSEALLTAGNRRPTSRWLPPSGASAARPAAPR